MQQQQRGFICNMSLRFSSSGSRVFIGSARLAYDKSGLVSFSLAYNSPNNSPSDSQLQYIHAIASTGFPVVSRLFEVRDEYANNAATS